jgi:hypothetical protein
MLLFHLLESFQDSNSFPFVIYITEERCATSMRFETPSHQDILLTNGVSKPQTIPSRNAEVPPILRSNPSNSSKLPTVTSPFTNHLDKKQKTDNA